MLQRQTSSPRVPCCATTLRKGDGARGLRLGNLPRVMRHTAALDVGLGLIPWPGCPAHPKKPMQRMAWPGIAAFLILSLLAVTACEWDGVSQSSSSQTGMTNPVATPNTVIATSSVSGTVTVVSGGTQTVTATFTASDSQGATRLTLTSGLESLPSGWTAPASDRKSVV